MKIGRKLLLIAMLAFSSITVANAEEFYQNEYGVSLSENEYNIISQIYWDGYQDTMNIDNYNYLLDRNIFESELETVEYIEDGITTYSTYHSTSNKSIKISKSCNTSCTIFTMVNWINMPSVRSYDVLGARFSGTSLNGNITTTLYLDNSKKNVTMQNNIKNNGFGVSIKLPTGGSNLKIAQSFDVASGGTVYASYQHARRTSTLAKSKDYTIAYNGYGSVFLFSNSTSSYYDAMGGVNISV